LWNLDERQRRAHRRPCRHPHGSGASIAGRAAARPMDDEARAGGL